VPQDDSPIRAALAEDERGHNPCRLAEAELTGNHRAQPSLGVESAKRVLEITDARLHLDHEQRPGPRVPCHQVAAAAVPVVIEAHFGPGYPARTRKTLRGGVSEGGVGAVDEPIEFRAVPAHLDNQGGIQRVGQSR